MARRRYKRAPKKQHGWDLQYAFNSVTVGDSTPGFLPYLTVRAIQSYSGGASNLVGEPDPFYCERVILDIYPYLFRLNQDVSPRRIWQYMLLTCDLQQLLTWAEFGASSLALASFWDNTGEIFDIAHRVLAQGTAPVYESAQLPQEGAAGKLFTGATGAASVFAVMPDAGPERVHLDLSTKFSLVQEDAALVLITGPTPTADWDDGDEFGVDMWCKSLWTRRRT